MSLKSFKDYIEESIAADYKAPKDSDKEATEYEPRSKGEKDFKDSHKGGKEEHPVADEGQFTSKGKEAGHSASGETAVVKQGSSKVS